MTTPPAGLTRHLLIGSLIFFLTAVTATVHSYFRSISLTFCDATVATDEGAISLQIPLVRLAANEDFETDATIYNRTKNGWEAASGAAKCPLDIWMAQSDQDWFHGWSVADFGYWRGDWQNDGRPGPFVVLFVPIWFLLLAIFVASAIVSRRKLRWSLATMLIVTTAAGVCFRLLTLRESVAG